MTTEIPSPLVLLIEDDATLLEEATDFLERERLAVVAVRDGAGALALGNERRLPDVIVVDLLLSTFDSYVICRALRGAFGVPLIITTPFASRFSGEADDVLTRPLDLTVLATRIRAVLTRTQPSVEVIRAGDLMVMPRAARAFLGDRELDVNADEVALLARLAATADRPVRKDDLRGTLRGVAADTDPRVVDVHLVRLMVKLEGARTVRLRRTPMNDAYVLSIAAGPAVPLAVPA